MKTMNLCTIPQKYAWNWLQDHVSMLRVVELIEEVKVVTAICKICYAINALYCFALNCISIGGDLMLESIIIPTNDCSGHRILSNILQSQFNLIWIQLLTNKFGLRNFRFYIRTIPFCECYWLLTHLESLDSTMEMRKSWMENHNNVLNFHNLP